ncbi:MAG: aldo/keto reductase, partial [Bryobacteraceae bacterium]
LVDKVRELAAGKGCTPAQLALAWVLARGEDIIPIPGTKRRTYLDEDLGALDIRLSAADLEQIDQIAPLGAASGTRYPEVHMKRVGL